MAEHDEKPLLELLRTTPAVPPSRSDRLIKALAEINNQLSDLKAKLDVANEIALERLELRRVEARPEFGAQARLYRNKPPRSLRKWN